jgi:hypothetical protein
MIRDTYKLGGVVLVLPGTTPRIGLKANDCIPGNVHDRPAMWTVRTPASSTPIRGWLGLRLAGATTPAKCVARADIVGKSKLAVAGRPTPKDEDMEFRSSTAPSESRPASIRGWSYGTAVPSTLLTTSPIRLLQQPSSLRRQQLSLVIGFP